MLTEDYIEKVERLTEQTGDYYGFGQDPSTPGIRYLGQKALNPEGTKPITISLHWEIDPDTGKYDLIQD